MIWLIRLIAFDNHSADTTLPVMSTNTRWKATGACPKMSRKTACSVVSSVGTRLSCTATGGKWRRGRLDRLIRQFLSERLWP